VEASESKIETTCLPEAMILIDDINYGEVGSGTGSVAGGAAEGT